MHGTLMVRRWGRPQLPPTPEFNPALSLEGFEDLYFAPGFDDLDSPEYHTHLFSLVAQWKADDYSCGSR